MIRLMRKNKLKQNTTKLSIVNPRQMNIQLLFILHELIILFDKLQRLGYD
jgi:hypothetical protein